jgi:hypothetical protein
MPRRPPPTDADAVAVPVPGWTANTIAPTARWPRWPAPSTG